MDYATNWSGVGTSDGITVIAGAPGLAGGWEHSLFLKSDGSAWGTGYNLYGQLGDGTTTERLSPVSIPAFAGVTKIAAGDDHSLAVKSDGSLWAWGSIHTGSWATGRPAAA